MTFYVPQSKQGSVDYSQFSWSQNKLVRVICSYAFFFNEMKSILNKTKDGIKHSV